MSLDDSTRVLEALNVLCKAPNEILLSHKTKLNAVVRKLAKLRTPVENLVGKLEDNLENIERRLSQECVEDIKSGPKWKDEDPRIVDIQITENSELTSDEKLRRVLGQRSLAMEFYDWKNNRQTSEDYQKQGRRSGLVSKYLSINRHRFKKVKVAERGINLGRKLLKFEKSLGVGFSALLIFCQTFFERVKEEQLIDLKDAIDKQHLDAIHDKQESVKQLSEQKAEWLDAKQTAYNEWYNNVKPSNNVNPSDNNPSDNNPSNNVNPSNDVNTRILAKRPLPPPPSNQRKRQKTILRKAGLQHVRTAPVRVGASATDPLTAPSSTNVSSDVAPLSAQQTQSDVLEQSQRPPNPLPSKNHVSSSVCDSINTHNTSGMAVGNTVHQSFHNSTQETQGSVLHGEEPIREDADNGPSRSNDPVPSYTSSITSMGSECHQGREHICQGNTEARNLIRINEREYHHQSRPSLDGGQSNAMSDNLTIGLVLQAANDASHENGEQNDGYNTIATVPLQNTPSEPFPVTAGGTQHLHGSGTATSADDFHDVWPISQSFDPTFYTDIWDISQPLDPTAPNDIWSYSLELLGPDPIPTLPNHPMNPPPGSF